MNKLLSGKILFLFASLLFLSVAAPSILGVNDAKAQTSSTTGNADDNAFVTTICNAYKIITGTGGKAFAAFAIISVGIGFFTGKVSWGLMIGVACGIAALFGAPTIVAAIGGGSAINCSWKTV